jgi:hypothetical protein
MTTLSFLIRHPEFATAIVSYSGLVDAALADAETAVSDSWGIQRDQVVALTAAATLAVSPFGRNARMVDEKGWSTYSKRLAELKYAHACGRARCHGGS